VCPGDAAALQAALEEALEGGEGHDIRFRVVPVRQKEERHLQMDVMTCYDERGAPLHLRCHLLDITERIRTERELRHSTQKISQPTAGLRQPNEALQRLKESYRDLYHFAPVLYFSLDPAGRFVAFNETMQRTLGYPREALLGQPYAKLLTPAS